MKNVKYFGHKKEDVIWAANLISMSGEGKFSYMPVTGDVVEENGNHYFYMKDLKGGRIPNRFSFNTTFPVSEFKKALAGDGYGQFILFNCENFLQVFMHIGDTAQEVQEAIDRTLVDMLYELYNIKSKGDLTRVFNLASKIDKKIRNGFYDNQISEDTGVV